MIKYRLLDISRFSDADFCTAYNGMSDARKSRCDRFKFDDDKRRMAFADRALRELIAESFETDDDSIFIENDTNGKPRAFVNGREVCVSISHSSIYVAVAIDKNPVGIDVEIPRKIKWAFAKAAVSENELNYIRGDDAELEKEKLSSSALARFLLVWTAKEAVLKLRGMGLGGGIKTTDVMPLIKSPKNSAGLTLHTEATDGYTLSVVYSE